MLYANSQYRQTQKQTGVTLPSTTPQTNVASEQMRNFAWLNHNIYIAADPTSVYLAKHGSLQRWAPASIGTTSFIRSATCILNQCCFLVDSQPEVCFSQSTSILTTSFFFYVYPQLPPPPPPPQSAHISLSSFFLQPPNCEKSSPKPLETTRNQHGAQHARVLTNWSFLQSIPDQDSRQCVMGQFCDIKYINRIQHTCKQHTSNVKMMSSPGHAGIL